jgi:hypothetical protein
MKLPYTNLFRVPRDKMAAIELNEPLPKVLQRVREQGHTRLPVYEGQLDNVVGIVNTKDLFFLIAQQGVFVLENAIYPAIYRASRRGSPRRRHSPNYWRVFRLHRRAAATPTVATLKRANVEGSGTGAPAAAISSRTFPKPEAPASVATAPWSLMLSRNAQ